jgi:hypothetical protein
MTGGGRIATAVAGTGAELGKNCGHSKKIGFIFINIFVIWII